MKILKIAIAFVIIGFDCIAQNNSLLKTQFDNEKWTEYIEGNMPLIISVPHGGSIVLNEVPLRECKRAVTVTDSKTIELAREIQKAFIKRYKLSPHIVICHLSRKNIDQNRELQEGTCSNKLMQKPWNQFHHYLDSALTVATAQFGKAIFIDLHGHGHINQRLELGYLLKGEELVDLENTFNNYELKNKSSMKNKLPSGDNYAQFKELLIGDNAFGTIISGNGYPAVPSKQDKAPLENEKYFDGGYNTIYFTSSKYPKVFGFQIESNYKGVRDEVGRPLFAKAFAKSFMKYMEKNTEKRSKNSSDKN